MHSVSSNSNYLAKLLTTASDVPSIAFIFAIVKQPGRIENEKDDWRQGILFGSIQFNLFQRTTVIIIRALRARRSVTVRFGSPLTYLLTPCLELVSD